MLPFSPKIHQRRNHTRQPTVGVGVGVDVVQVIQLRLSKTIFPVFVVFVKLCEQRFSLNFAENCADSPLNVFYLRLIYKLSCVARFRVEFERKIAI